MKTYIIELDRQELIKLINVINESNRWDRYITYERLIKYNNYESFKIELNAFELKRINHIIHESNAYSFFDKLRIEGDITSALCYWKLKELKNKKHKNHEIYN